MYDTRQIRKGLKVEIEGAPYSVIDFQHVSPGKGAAFTRTKLKNLLTGNTMERSFRSGEKLTPANTMTKEMQYLYSDSDGFHFMDTTNYEQVLIGTAQLAEIAGFLQENINVQILFYNDRPIDVELPNSIETAVVQTDPAFKGDTVTGGSKPAKIASGAMVQVPFHIKEGDIIKVDTRSGQYVERVNR